MDRFRKGRVFRPFDEKGKNGSGGSTLNRRITQLQREEKFSNMEHLQNQKAVHRDLMNIKAAKGQPAGSRTGRRSSRVEKGETIQDMINRFKNKRIEQTMVNDLLRQRRESLIKIEEDMRKRSPAKLWDSVTESRADILRISNARQSHDDIIDDIRRSVDESENFCSVRDDDIENFIEHVPGILRDEPNLLENSDRKMSSEEDRHKAGVRRKYSIENVHGKERKRSLESVEHKHGRSRRSSLEERNKAKHMGPFHRRKSLQMERERPTERRGSRPRVYLDDQAEVQALRNIQRELPIYALSRPPPVYLTEKYIKKRRDSKVKVGLPRENAVDFSNIGQERPKNKPHMYNDTLSMLKGKDLTGTGKKYLKKPTNNAEAEVKKDDEFESLEREYTCKWDLVSNLSSDEKSTTDETWDDVRRCKYLRGYDPPEMIMPKEEINVFVFGRNENDIMDLKRAERKRSVSTPSESVPEEICVV